MAPIIRIFCLMLIAGCSPPPSDLGHVTYPLTEQVQCAYGSLSGVAGRSNHEQTKRGIDYIVRTPLNYDATRDHPLLVVFSPGDRDAIGTEWFTRLTTLATSAGFIVVYANNRPRNAPSIYRPISKEWILELGTVADEVATKWCIDKDSIFYTGHSNGGTVSTALALMETTRGSMAAIAPSAAGFAAENFNEFSCPTPLSVMILHSDTDQLFNGYGRQAIDWWRQCNRCDEEPTELDNGCLQYNECINEVVTQLCPGQEHHTKWPDRAEDIVDFFKAVRKL